jgi:hypothetical protein
LRIGRVEQVGADVGDDRLRERALGGIPGGHVGQQRELAVCVVDLSGGPVRLMDERAEPGQVHVRLQPGDLRAQPREQPPDLRELLLGGVPEAKDRQKPARHIDLVPLRHLPGAQGRSGNHRSQRHSGQPLQNRFRHWPQRRLRRRQAEPVHAARGARPCPCEGLSRPPASGLGKPAAGPLVVEEPANERADPAGAARGGEKAVPVEAAVAIGQVGLAHPMRNLQLPVGQAAGAGVAPIKGSPLDRGTVRGHHRGDRIHVDHVARPVAAHGGPQPARHPPPAGPAAPHLDDELARKPPEREQRHARAVSAIRSPAVGLRQRPTRPRGAPAGDGPAREHPHRAPRNIGVSVGQPPHREHRRFLASHAGVRSRRQSEREHAPQHDAEQHLDSPRNLPGTQPRDQGDAGHRAPTAGSSITRRRSKASHGVVTRTIRGEGRFRTGRHPERADDYPRGRANSAGRDPGATAVSISSSGAG